MSIFRKTIANHRSWMCLILAIVGTFLNEGYSWADDSTQTNAATYRASLDSTNVSSTSRRLQPNDMLEVSVYQEPDLATKVSIDDRGMVELPLIGTVKLAGLTLEQATALVRDLYDKDYLVNPQVTIQVDQLATLRFTVLGQVQRPGDFEFPPNESLNLLEGIAMAGGYTRLANPTRVTLQRNVNGQLKVFQLDAQAMAIDKNNKPFQLLPNDTITVEERVF